MSSSSPTQISTPSSTQIDNNTNSQNKRNRFDDILFHFFTMYSPPQKIPENISKIEPKDSSVPEETRIVKLFQKVVVNYLLYKSDNQMKTLQGFLANLLFIEKEITRFWGCRVLKEQFQDISVFTKPLHIKLTAMKTEVTIKIKEEEHLLAHSEAINNAIEHLEKDINTHEYEIRELHSEILKASSVDSSENQTNNTVSQKKSLRLQELNDAIDMLNKKIATYKKELAICLEELKQYEQNLNQEVEEIYALGESIKNDVDPLINSSSSSSSKSPSESSSSSSSSSKSPFENILFSNLSRPSPNPLKHEKKD